MSNFGDDLFGALCAKGALAFWGQAASIAGPPIPGVPATYTMPSWIRPNIYGSGYAGPALRLLSFARGLRNSNLFILGGGSTVYGRATRRRQMMLNANARRGTKLAAVGISIGPFFSAHEARAAAEFLRRFEYVSVRDTRSFEEGLSLGLRDRLHQGRDLAGLLPAFAGLGPRKPTPQRPDKPRVVGIALCNYRTSSRYPAPSLDTLMPSIAASLATLAPRRPLHVRLFSLNGHRRLGDGRLTALMMHELISRGISCDAMFYGNGRVAPMAMAKVIGECDAFISARLHGGLVAYVQGIPFTLIDYHPKCRDFAADIGLQDALQIGHDRCSLDAVSHAIETMLDSGPCVAFSPDIYADQALGIFSQSPWARA